MRELRINGDRLWASIMEMAEIGGTSDGGCNRQALTELDKQGRNLFVTWCKDAGCTVTVDAMGNIFARRHGPGKNTSAVITGSHLDTQPTGGKFDGVYGVLAGLEVIRTLNDANVETTHPIEVVCWTNEEGARFSPALIGSGVWSGVFELEYGHSRLDKQGISIKQSLEDIGYLGETAAASSKNIKAAFELHIEQGPILEDKGKQIGIVSGVQGMNWYDVTLVGVPCHAGPSPMDVRVDPVMGAAKIINRLYKLVDQYKPWSRVTFGDIKVEPGVRNTVPKKLILSVDLRHPDQNTLNRMDLDLRAIVEEICTPLMIDYQIFDEWASQAVSFAESCINAVRQSVSELDYSSEEMFSGAGHDSVYVSRVAPTSMIFIPCEGGISHNASEKATPADIEAGCNVLLHAMLKTAS